MALFTKRHYNWIANVLQKERRQALHDSDNSVDILILGLAAEFERDNPKFDRVGFVIACHNGAPEVNERKTERKTDAPEVKASPAELHGDKL